MLKTLIFTTVLSFSAGVFTSCQSRPPKQNPQVADAGYLEGCIFGMVHVIVSLGGTPLEDAVISACMALHLQKLERENTPVKMQRDKRPTSI